MNANEVYSPTITGQGFFATCTVYCLARSAASFTRKPIFGWEGSMMGWMPNSSSASVVVGPMEHTWHRRRLASAASSMPSSRATLARCTTWMAVVDKGLQEKDIKFGKLDTFVGSVLTVLT